MPARRSMINLTLHLTTDSSPNATIDGMNSTPSVTPAQYGAGGIFLAVATACLTSGVTGTDLLAYLGCSTLVTVGLVISDALIRRGRAGIEANRALVEPPADAPVSVDVKAGN